MAIKNREELLKSVSAILKENNSDDVISLYEDLSDTLKDLEEKGKEQTDWKTKFEENDKAWRDKYVARFTSGEEVKTDLPAKEDVKDTLVEEVEEKTHFEDLFTTEDK